MLEECKQYTKLYSVTHGDVLLDRIDKEGNIFLKVLPLDKNLTLKLDECGRLYEKGSCVLFPTIWNTWEGFDPYATTIESPFEAGMVGYNEHLNEFGIISDDGSFMTNVDGSRISPIDRLATEVEIDIWNQENHKKHRHYSLPRKKYVYYFQPFDNRRYCIPYNEETAHLVGETDDYEGDEIEKIIKECKLTEGKLD